jgi:ribosome-binding factor A
MSIRQEKFARQLQRDLAAIFQERTHAWFSGIMITVTEVHVSPDLGYAKAYLSILDRKRRGEAMDQVDMFSREIRQELARRIRHEVRKVPELAFFEDETLDYADKMDRIFKQLNKDSETDTEQP